MLPNAFIGQSTAPTDSELSNVLGRSKAFWDQLVASLQEDGSISQADWHSYSVKAGWSLRLQQKKRNILYLLPWQGSFGAALVFGDRAVQSIRTGKFPAHVIQLLDEAKKYPEGTGIRLEVKGAKDLVTVRKLVAVKLEPALK